MASTNSQLKNVGVVVVVFAVVGAGIGLTGYFGVSGLGSVMQTGGQGGGGFGQLFVALFGFVAVLIAFLLGPVVAAIAGLLAGLAFRERQAGAVVGGAGSFVGFYVMAVVAIGAISAAFPGASGGVSLDVGDQLTTILKAGVPSGVVGAVSGVVGVDFGG